MKKRFYNSEGKNTAVLTCKNNKGEFNLHFQLLDNPVQHIWQQIHANNTDIITDCHPGEDINILLDDLDKCCVQVTVPPLTRPVTQRQLNWLHSEFVKNEKNKYWIRINHLIHMLENKIDNPFAKFDSSLLFFAKNEQFVPIKDEYKLFLTSDVNWGKLILGYGTVGKDWIDIATNNDDISDLAIQSQISSETRIMFCSEQVLNLYQNHKFYKWATTTDIDVPLGNLNALSLGRYVLGQIIITDTLLAYHNDANDWYVPNHRCKLSWNKEVFTPDTKIVKIEFKDTDLFFESLITHTEFEKLNV